MFFSVFYAIPPVFTSWHTLLNSGLFQRASLQSLPRMEYLLNGSETMIKNNKYCTLTNTFCLTKFGSVMNKLRCFYPKHLILNSFRTGHKPYFPRCNSQNTTTHKMNCFIKDTWICFLTFIAISWSESLQKKIYSENGEMTCK